MCLLPCLFLFLAKIASGRRGWRFCIITKLETHVILDLNDGLVPVMSSQITLCPCLGELCCKARFHVGWFAVPSICCIWVFTIDRPQQKVCVFQYISYFVDHLKLWCTILKSKSRLKQIYGNNFKMKHSGIAFHVYTIVALLSLSDQDIRGVPEDPCKHAITCWFGLGIETMCSASVHLRFITGTLWHVHKGIICMNEVNECVCERGSV